jgi:hypothetical protein
MISGQRAVVGLGLVGAFLISVAAGGLLARELHGLPTPLVAVVSPSPGASPSASVPSSVTASSPPASTGLPTLSPALPTATPTAAPIPTPTAILDPPTAADFAAALLSALQTGNDAYLNGRLHPAVIDRYGASQCTKHVSTFGPDPSAQWTVVTVNGPAPWSWVTDSLTTVIPDTRTVTVDEPSTGQRDLHFAPSDGTWRWFLDCGKPL